MLLYHLDEHVSHAIAKGLRSRRIDVSTTSDAGLVGASDLDHIEYGLRESRVIFTDDADFLRLAASGQTHAGIVYCHPSKSDVGEVVRFLALLHDCLGPEDLFGKIEFL